MVTIKWQHGNVFALEREDGTLFRTYDNFPDAKVAALELVVDQLREQVYKTAIELAVFKRNCACWAAALLFVAIAYSALFP